MAKKKMGIITCPFCGGECREPEVLDISHQCTCLATYTLVKDADLKIREALREGKTASTVDGGQATIVFAK